VVDGRWMMMTGSETIGIMADSHGDPDAIAAAIFFFQEMGCRRMVHLGDICDSVSFDLADRCVGLLRKHNVLAVRGNNDHAVVKNGEAVINGSISMETAAYLESLPLQIEISEAIFVHSRPFADTLGLSAMTGEIGKVEAARFLKRYPGKVLFRGHGHAPRVTRIPYTRNTQNSPVPGKKVRLEGAQSWIITCGALYRGMCMIWAPGERVIISHRINPLRP
jgi:predicted phosphodiesterase